MTTARHVGLVVLGAGPGGYVAAIRAAQLGLDVAVIEARWWGGVCLNVGCIPTKALLRNAEIADLIVRQGAAFGIGGQIEVDYTAGWRRSRAVADTMSRGVHFLMEKNHVATIEGRGVFTGPHAMTVADATTSELTFDHAIIATGAVPMTLPNVRIGSRVMTYEQLILAETLPKRLVIAGSGAVGMEFATLASSFGCAVTIVESLDRLAPAEDEAVSRELTRAFRRRGIDVLTGVAVTAAEESESGLIVQLTPSGGGERRSIEADALLVATGFAAPAPESGLDAAGVRLDDRGFIAVDDVMATNVPHIHAVGDVTGKMMLAHVAERQGVVAAEAIAGGRPKPIDYDSVPRATYCEPSIASLGLTTAQATASGRRVKVGRFQLAANGKAQALGEPGGFVMLVADADSHELLGAHMVGSGVTELLPELVLAKTSGLTTDDLAVAIHAHPSLSEAIKGAAEAVSGQTIDA